MSRKVTIAVAGNPNTGKTTLFNTLTKSRARVANYPGVTVEGRIGRVSLPRQGLAELVDIPGTYSLVARTSEEQIAADVLIGLAGHEAPDAVLICVDATQLVRSLYLALQILELGLPTVVALTMGDEAGAAAPDAEALAQTLGCPVVAVVAPKKQGLDRLKKALDEVVSAGKNSVSWCWRPSPALRLEMDRVKKSLPSSWPRNDAVALWCLSSIGEEDELAHIPADVRSLVQATTLPGQDIDTEVAAARYAWLDAQVGRLARVPVQQRLTDRLDRILLNRVAGFGIFLALMFVVFQSLFAWADPAIDAVDQSVSWLQGLARDGLPRGLFNDFLVNGVIAGLGAVLVFLPQILLLFFFLGLMEDSGYLARVAYLMDRIMRTMNLHGRAFVPMMSGFACAVPAILATRTLERRRDRLLTMMVVPLMTCSARLPVYTLIIAALFPAGHWFGVFPVQGTLLVAMYLFSVTVALVAAWVLSKTMKQLRGKRLPFVIELPPYRRPRLRDVVRMMITRSGQFIREAGTVILACTVVLWALLSFPRDLPKGSRNYDALAVGASAERVASLEQEKSAQLLRHSYGGRLGRFLEPAIAPLGFDWQMGIGLIGAFAAREVFVSTMGVVHSVGDDADETSQALREKISSAKRSDGSRMYTPLVGLSLMIFFALACQCASTLAVVKRETRGYRWPVFLFAYMTVLAWVASFSVYQIGRMLGFS